MLPAIAIAVGGLALAAIELRDHPPSAKDPMPTSGVGGSPATAVETVGGTQISTPTDHSTPSIQPTGPLMSGEASPPPPAPAAPTFRDVVKIGMINTSRLTPREVSDVIQQTNSGGSGGMYY